MLQLIVLTIVAVTVAVVALQNGHPVTVSFLFWQFDAPLAVVILGATVAGLVIGGVTDSHAPCAAGAATARRGQGQGQGRAATPTLRARTLTVG